MYTNKKNALELIALLKAFDIKNVVISAGSRHIPFAVSIEKDNYFNSFSVIDERSAAYFAIGIILKTHEPCVICCTSGTAAANYYPAVAEAFYQKLPLIVVTGDKPYFQLNQNSGQMIPQAHIFKDVTKYEIDITECSTENELWYANLKMNEALLSLNFHGSAPIHINLQASAPLDVFDTQTLPNVRKISRFNNIYTIPKTIIVDFVKQLIEKNILIAFGQHMPLTHDEKEILKEFIHNFKPCIIADNTSNLGEENIISKSNECLRQIPIVSKKKFYPDIVITCGGQMISTDFFTLVKESNCTDIWHIDADGAVQDELKGLKVIFSTDFFEFCKYANSIKNESFLEVEANSGYLDLWMNIKKQLKCQIENFSDLYVSRSLLTALPENTALHLANSNSIRYGQMTSISEGIPVLCNRGTSGIDGCVSTAVGYSALHDGLTVLLVGDLTFFYDSNGLWNKHLSKNFRVLLNNNSIGELLNSQWKSFRNDNAQSIFGHNNCSAKGIAESMGMDYISASNKDEFDTLINYFLNLNSEKPILFEVFTSVPENEKALQDYQSSNQSMDRVIYHKLKNISK